MRFLFVSPTELGPAGPAELCRELVQRFGHQACDILVPTVGEPAQFVPARLAKKSYDKVLCFGAAPPPEWSESGELIVVPSEVNCLLGRLPEDTLALWPDALLPAARAALPNLDSRSLASQALETLFKNLFEPKTERQKSSARLLVVLTSLDYAVSGPALAEVRALSELKGTSVFLSLPARQAQLDQDARVALALCGARLVDQDPEVWSELELDAALIYSSGRGALPQPARGQLESSGAKLVTVLETEGDLGFSRAVAARTPASAWEAESRGREDIFLPPPVTLRHPEPLKTARELILASGDLSRAPAALRELLEALPFEVRELSGLGVGDREELFSRARALVCLDPASLFPAEVALALGHGSPVVHCRRDLQDLLGPAGSHYDESEPGLFDLAWLTDPEELGKKSRATSDLAERLSSPVFFENFRKIVFDLGPELETDMRLAREFFETIRRPRSVSLVGRVSLVKPDDRKIAEEPERRDDQD